jgi:hypothetical protein
MDTRERLWTILYALITIVVMAIVWIVVAMLLLTEGTIDLETIIIGSSIVAVCTGAAMWTNDP